MMTNTLIEQLKGLKLHGLAASLERQIADETSDAMSFEERLGLMIQNETAERDSLRMRQRLR